MGTQLGTVLVRSPYHGPVELEALRRGDIRAVARAISAIESADPGIFPAIAELRRGRAGDGSHVVGLTGAPGSGKSTLADALTAIWRAAGRRVAVLAVDPNSPFTGGALLGDRVRMQGHALDPGVFIRSMGARGHLGGLALATRAAVRLLDALGWEMVLVETVGVGQSELEICELADTVVVVATPAAGDSVQVIKAGITEIADVFAVNKADLPGADRVARELRDMLRLSAASEWRTLVVKSVAAQGPEGVVELASAIEAHHGHLRESGEGEARARRQLLEEVVGLVEARAAVEAREVLAREGEAFLGPDPELAQPELVADLLLARIAATRSNMGAAPGSPPGPLRRS